MSPSNWLAIRRYHTGRVLRTQPVSPIEQPGCKQTGETNPWTIGSMNMPAWAVHFLMSALQTMFE
jgi:hypothetical protein